MGPTGTAAEAEADRVADSASASPPVAPVIQRQPDMGGINLEVREDGRVQFTVVGPKVPAVGNPALGLRRRPDGTIEFLFGSSSKVVTPAEVPGILRGALNDSSRQTPGTKAPLKERMPTCPELRRPDGSVKPWVEHRAEEILSGRQPLPRTFYEGLAAVCPPAPAEEPLPGPQPAGPETMPVDSDEAMA